MNQLLSSGTGLWNKAKKMIPGGNQLLSKRAEMFLPDQWPSYYKKAKGVEIWDLDNNRYIDMGIMGIGSCVMGYANDEVDAAVKKAIKDGSMSTLNCYEEVELAEKLVELHPWSDMVRFSRTGGEACMIAVRIARAYSKKDKVAFCGYHGWGDWYLSANLGDAKHLDGQLLPGLEPNGVPRVLKNTSFPFQYGKIDELEKIITENKNEVGAIIMEVQRYKELDLEFLKAVREIADRNEAVLIFDEITSGFRLRPGGLHILHSLVPDMVILGKAMGNGYPITAVVGKRNIMNAAQETFISSTFWTERVGFVAALEVIRQFEKNDVPAHLVRTGTILIEGLKKIFSSLNQVIEIVGLPTSPFMNFKGKKSLVIKTVFIQEMMKQGYLASPLVFLSYAHTREIIDSYLKVAEGVFNKISSALKAGKIEGMLEGPVCHSGFRRLI